MEEEEIQVGKEKVDLIPSDIIYLANKDKSIIIRFDKIFTNLKENANLNEFVIKRRSACNIIKQVANSIIELFECKTIPLYFVKVAVNLNKVSDKFEYTKDNFITDLLKIIKNKAAFDFISNKIENTYTDNLDEQSKQSKKVNEELQFTDAHAKVIFKAAEGMRLTIPLILKYCELYNLNDSDLMYEIFIQIIDIFTPSNNVKIMNKIHRFVYSRLMATQYSDSVIWSKLNAYSKNVDVYTNDFCKDIVVAIFPKIDISKSLISFLHVVIRKKIQCEFIKKYRIDFKPINTNNVDSDGISEFEKMDINLTKINEGKAIINKLTIANEIKRLPQIFGSYAVLTDDELKYYYQYLNTNNLQIKLTFMFYSKLIGNYSSLYNASKEEYTKLVVIFHKWLAKHNLNYLSELIIAKPEKNTDRMKFKSTKSNIVDKILGSTAYDEILKHKYQLASDKIDDTSIIVKIVGEITISKFVKLEEYKPGYNKDNIYTETLPDDIQNIFTELVSLIQYF